MQVHLFQYPIPTDSTLDDLNALLASHKVVSMHKEIVRTGDGAFLFFIVETASANTNSNTRNRKIDYKEVLTPEQFAVYSQLRDTRKQLAEAEGVPVYAVFTNAQLAEMATGTVRTIDAISAITGVGAARSDRFGEAMLKVLLNIDT